MRDLDFNKGDTVYTQDGTNYYFDHVAGEHGYVSPIIIIQTANYHGDDFEEHEEVADHMIPIHLSRLSKTPWVRKIHEETTEALAEKKQVLDDLNRQIGAARTELRTAEDAAAARKKVLEEEARVLERRYQWVRDFRRMTGDDETHVLAISQHDDLAPPYACNPFDIRLKMDTKDRTKWHYLGQYDDGDEHIAVFDTKSAMETRVWNDFVMKRDKMTVEQELKWAKQWPNLPVSDEAKAQAAAQEEEKRLRNLSRAQDALTRAQADVDRWTKKDD